MQGQVRSILACPTCRGRLEWAPTTVSCPACESEYAFEAGVPLLLPSGTSSPTTDEQWTPPPAKGLTARLAALRRRFPGPPSTYKTARSARQVVHFVDSFEPDAYVLNIGSGESDYGPKVLNLDIVAGPRIDVVGVAEALPVADASCDGAILMAVLEHVEDAERTLAEVRRILSPGGRVLIDVPFIQGYHASPGDFRRFTEQGLRVHVERHGFVVEQSGVSVGPASAMAWITTEFLALLFSGHSAYRYKLARALLGPLVSPIKYADAWLDEHPLAFIIASGVWVIARAEAP